MQCLAGDVKEGEVGLRLAQPHRHEALPVVEELHLVGGGLELASPCLGPAATRQELKMAAIFFGSQHKNQCKKTSRVQLLDPCRSPDVLIDVPSPVSAADALQAVVMAVHVHVDAVGLRFVSIDGDEAQMISFSKLSRLDADNITR